MTKEERALYGDANTAASQIVVELNRYVDG